MKKNYSFLFFIIFSFGLNAQVILTENFNTPVDWDNAVIASNGILWAFDNNDSHLTASMTHNSLSG